MQVVGYETGVGGLSFDPAVGVTGEPAPAALRVADDGTVTRVTLEPGVDLAFTLGPRRCAGVLRDGAHEPCDEPGGPYCPRHSDEWPCARCDGRCDRPLPSCREEHAVYLAGFAPATVKVGVTRLTRLPARLREQGADVAAHVHSVSDGRIARQLEREMAADRTDRVTVATKVAGLHRDMDDAAWDRALDGVSALRTFRFDYGLDLDARPMAETLATGAVRGTQGRLLVLDAAAGTYAVDLRDLVGHEVTPGATGRDLQSSLGVFR